MSDEKYVQFVADWYWVNSDDGTYMLVRAGQAPRASEYVSLQTEDIDVPTVNVESIRQLWNALALSTPHKGKLADFNEIHRSNALMQTILQAGKLASVNALQLVKAYVPIIVHTGKLIDVNLLQEEKA